MGEQPVAGEQKKVWESPAVLAAMISGTFALLGTVTTATISWMNRQPPPTAQVVMAPESQHSALNSRNEEIRTATANVRDSVTPVLPLLKVEPRSRTDQPAPNWALNFVEFQRAMKDREFNQHAVVDLLPGKIVIWEGYVDSISTHTSPSADSSATVTLCESPELLTQSMFKMPAYCRFSVDRTVNLSQLKVGEKVTITGTFDSHSAVGTIVTGCSVLKEESTRISRQDSSATR